LKESHIEIIAHQIDITCSNISDPFKIFTSNSAKPFFLNPLISVLRTLVLTIVQTFISYRIDHYNPEITNLQFEFL
jgi:hypothetical protein